MALSLSIPITVEKISPEHERPYYEARLAFYPDDFVSSHEREDRAIGHLEDHVQQALSEHAKEPKHELITDWSFHPELARHHLSLTVRMRRRTFEGRFLIIVFQGLDRRLAYCPKAALTFEWQTGQSLEARAEEALSEAVRASEKARDELDLSTLTTPGFVRLSQIDLTTNVQQVLKLDEFSRPIADLGSSDEMSGAAELPRVARCLDRLYPNDLPRAILRDREAEQLVDLFSAPAKDRRPVVLVGPSLVGKTSIIREFVCRRLDRLDHPSSSSKKVWQLHPQRLISGMSFVGQWEERFFAIVKEVRRQGHIIVIDDLLGLFHAGKSAQSELTAAHLLKVELEENPIDLIAEATPEVWRRLREQDRAFSDLFQVIPVRECSEVETLRVLIRVMQDLESKDDRRLAPEVLPLVIELQRRFARSRAFPGKAVDFLKQLTKTYRNIGADEVRAHFQQRTGINTLFLSAESLMPRQQLDQFFEGRIAGQKAAVSAMTDAVMLTKARLNDPSRPLASLLFLGPTGVGKTECAKALVEFVFGSADRLLRFDMNEYAGPDAVDRLTGNLARPQGLLTTAIRRQPYTVLLLDEIEKAHPDVFDLLLQILGDGRLTDFSGQTADFGNALIILTSNLGARQSKVPLGFATDPQDHSEVYIKAAENFFRPELFNRLDRIVAFHELSRSHIEQMVRQLTHQALRRHGVRSRKLMLEVESSVYPLLADRGFEPAYGARALRRAIESEIILPLSQSLTTQPFEGLTTLRLSAKDNRVQLNQQTFREAERLPALFPAPFDPKNAEDLSETVNAFLKQADDRLDGWMDSLNDVQEKLPFYGLREDLAHIRHLRDRVQSEAEGALKRRRDHSREVHRPRPGIKRLPMSLRSDILTTIQESPNSRQGFLNLSKTCVEEPALTTIAEALILRMNRVDVHLREANLPAVESVTWQLAGNHPTLYAEAVLLESHQSPSGGYLNALEWVRSALRLLPDGQVDPCDPAWESLHQEETRMDAAETLLKGTLPNLQGKSLVFRGLSLKSILAHEEGVHLFYTEDGGLHYIIVSPHANVESRNLPVIRLHHEMGWTLDLRTGILLEETRKSWWPFIDHLLPLCPTLEPHIRC